MTYNLTQLFDQSFFEGTATVASDVPGLWDVALDGHKFMVDWMHVSYVGMREGSYFAQSVPVTRTQADTSNEPGEQTLSPDAPWRRASESWHAGAGQQFQDRPESDRNRFWTSKGVNPWTRYTLTLLNGTTKTAASSGTNQYLAVGDGMMWRSDGTSVYHSTDGTSWTTISGLPGLNVVSLTSDGSSVYVGFESGDIYHGTTTLTTWTTGNTVTVTPGVVRASATVGVPAGTVQASGSATVTPPTVTARAVFPTLTMNAALTPWVLDMVRYCNGRLLIGSGPNLYNPLTAGPLPEPLVTHDSTTWKWVDACPGPKFIYAAGRSGSTSQIYKVGLNSDASGLAVPTVAGALEPGEVVRCLVNIQGSILVGTDKGARYAQADSNGDLVFGELIPTTSPVLCGATWDRFAWFGCTDYDSTSTGLMRCDPLTFTDPLTPAYATDLMAAAQGAVQSVVFFNDLCHFTVSGVGVFKDSGAPVSSGTITSGRVTYNLPDIKNLLDVDVLHEPLHGSVTVAITPDDATAVTLGSSSIAGTTGPETPISASQRPVRWFTHTLTLEPASGVSPVLHRVTAHAWPAPHRVMQYTVPLLFEEELTLGGGSTEAPFDCVAAEAVLQEMLESGRYVTYQAGSGSAQVFVVDTNFIRRTTTSDRLGHQGTMVVTLMGT